MKQSKRQEPAEPDDLPPAPRMLGSRRQGKPILHPPVDTKPTPWTNTPPKPSTSKRSQRKKRSTNATIGGKGAHFKPGDMLEGNLPHCQLTEELTTKLVDLIRRGAFRRVAVRALGINIHTYNQWIDTGRTQIQEVLDGKRTTYPLQAKLAIEIDKAEAECFIECNDEILDADGDVKDRTLRFAWSQKRFQREWAPPAHANDDQTGQQTEVDVVNLLVSRLQALKDAG